MATPPYLVRLRFYLRATDKFLTQQIQMTWNPTLSVLGKSQPTRRDKCLMNLGQLFSLLEEVLRFALPLVDISKVALRCYRTEPNNGGMV